MEEVSVDLLLDLFLELLLFLIGLQTDAAVESPPCCHSLAFAFLVHRINDKLLSFLLSDLQVATGEMGLVLRKESICVLAECRCCIFRKIDSDELSDGRFPRVERINPKNNLPIEVIDILQALLNPLSDGLIRHFNIHQIIPLPHTLDDLRLHEHKLRLLRLKISPSLHLKHLCIHIPLYFHFLIGGDLLVGAEEVVDIYHGGDKDLDVVGSEEVVEGLREIRTGFAGANNAEVIFAVFVD